MMPCMNSIDPEGWKATRIPAVSSLKRIHRVRGNCDRLIIRNTKATAFMKGIFIGCVKISRG